MLQEIKSSESGQVLLIVILVIIISLTIGLSLASRGITNLRTSTEEADSQKALAAAEAGIEKALQNTVSSSGSFAPSVTYETNVSQQTGNTFLLNGGSLITQGEGADVWLANHDPDGTINYSNTPARSPQFFNIYWGVGDETACDDDDPSTWPAAIEVIVISGNPPSFTTKRYVYDYCEDDRDNNFDEAHDANSHNIIGGTEFGIRTDNSIDITNGIFVRVIPIYKSAKIGIKACNPGGANCTTLPSQGFQITSTGTTGRASRKLNVFKGYPQIFLPYISYGLLVPKKL